MKPSLWKANLAFETETPKLPVVGALTLVGQTHDVPIDVRVQLGPDTLRVSSTFSIKQTDFGIKPYRGGPAGSVKVADRVAFKIQAIAVRTAPDSVGTGR